MEPGHSNKMIACGKSFNGHVSAAGEFSEKEPVNLFHSDQLLKSLNNPFYPSHVHLRVTVDVFAVGGQYRTKTSK